MVDDDTLHDLSSSLVGCRYARKLLRVAEIERRVGVDENPFIGICCLLPHSRKLQASTSHRLPRRAVRARAGSPRGECHSSPMDASAPPPPRFGVGVITAEVGTSRGGAGGVFPANASDQFYSPVARCRALTDDGQTAGRKRRVNRDMQCRKSRRCATDCRAADQRPHGAAPRWPDRAANRVLATGFSLPPALRLAANVENLAVRDDELIGGLIALPVRW